MKEHFRGKNQKTHSVAFPEGQILEENLAHEIGLLVTQHVEHARRQVPLQRAENVRAEIQLHVLVPVGLVLLVRVQPQPQARRCRRHGAVSAGAARRWCIAAVASLERHFRSGGSKLRGGHGEERRGN